MKAPVVLIDGTANHKARTVPVGSLSDLLPVAQALSNPQLKRWLSMQEGMGPMEAWQTCANGPEREAFLKQWNLAQREIESGALLSIDQLVEVIAESRHAFQQSPRELLLVILEKVEGKRPQLISMRVSGLA